MENVQKMDRDLNSVVKQIMRSCKVQSVDEVTHTLLMKPSACSKDALASFVEKLLKLSTSSLELCQNAVVNVDRLKSERIEIQQTVIDLQQKQLSHVRDAVQSSVKDSVKTEISSWSDIVKKNMKSASVTASVATVQKAVRSAVEENVRSNNFIIYGGEEEEPTEWNESGFENCIDFASGLFNEIRAFPKPEILTATRIGSQKKPDKPRPIKVTLASPEAVKFVLSKASKLKTNNHKHWRCVYLAPDRSKEERAAYSKLTTELKQKISEDASKYHYIRDGKIVSVDRVRSTAGTASNPDH